MINTKRVVVIFVNQIEKSSLLTFELVCTFDTIKTVRVVTYDEEMGVQSLGNP